MTTMHRILWLSMVLSLAPLGARAGEDAAAGERSAPAASAQATPARSVDPATLGKVEGILDFCAKVSGQLPRKDENRAARMLGAASEQQVAEARDSDDYKDSHDGITAELDKVPVDQARKACSQLAKGG